MTHSCQVSIINCEKASIYVIQYNEVHPTVLSKQCFESENFDGLPGFTRFTQLKLSNRKLHLVTEIVYSYLYLSKIKLSYQQWILDKLLLLFENADKYYIDDV